MKNFLPRKIAFALGMFLTATQLAIAELNPTPSPSPNSQQQISDWPQWRGPNRDGISRETAWLSQWPEQGPSILWKANVGKGYAAVSISNGKAYTMGRDEVTTGGAKQIVDAVGCLNAETGKPVWNYPFTPTGKYSQPGDNGPASTPAIADGAVYALGLNGEFFCLDAATGRLRWSKDLMKEFGVKPCNYGFSCSPLVTGNMVILEVGRTIAFNKQDGSVIWKTEDFTTCYSSPVTLQFNNEPSIASFNGTGLLIFKLADGSELFRQEWSVPGINNVNSSTPIVSGNKVFLASAYEAGWGLVELTGGKKPPILWRRQHELHVMTTPVLRDGYLYGFDGEKLVCMKFETGDTQWTHPGLGKGALILAGDKLMIMSEKGELVLAEATPSGYKPLASAQVLGPTCWTIPVLSAGRVYCRNSKGQVACVDLRQK